MFAYRVGSALDYKHIQVEKTNILLSFDYLHFFSSLEFVSVSNKCLLFKLHRMYEYADLLLTIVIAVSVSLSSRGSNRLHCTKRLNGSRSCLA